MAPRKSTVTRAAPAASSTTRSASTPSTATVMAMQFATNERVLCYHGPLIYEAKILKSEHWDETNTKNGEVGPHYFVHYKGWKQTYVNDLFLCVYLWTHCMHALSLS